ncbi:MAG TPA: HAMP domain-containing sensor histidine kinase, partial [Anaeromyxobacteraceae bacterium]|nr:HAMP domain-containing sensor histidine kinase [Anaeromyxobacteraceae bacterium]
AVRDAEHGVVRASAIVADVMRFAHPVDPGVREPVDVAEELAAAVKLTAYRVQRAGRLELDAPPTLPEVLARRNELSQVIVNLVANAVDALPPDRTDGNRIRVTARAAPGEVTIEIEDNGCGIAPELLPRIFDPFVTTKDVGRGTGLGLSVCHGIVTALGGRIEVESEPGKGTRFRVVLPTADLPQSA